MRRSQLRTCLIFAGLIVLSNMAAFAQQVVVQQPIVSSSSVRTTVAVPDRGQIFLGGVSSAESSRHQFGFAPHGSSLGRALSSRSSSATVRIIDLHEMDEAILQAASADPSRRSLASRPIETRVAPAVKRSPSEEAARLESLALRAEERGQTGVAKLHREAAARQRAGGTVLKPRLR